MLGSETRVIIAAFSLLLSCGAAVAQSNFGEIRGQVTDPSGAAIPNATVQIKDAATNAVFTLKTSVEGLFAAPALKPVTYDVTIDAAGFQKTTVTGVKVDTAKIATVDVSLRTGTVTEVVNITAEAPLLQTYTGAVTNTVDQRTIVEMPLNGRNTIELAMTLPATAGSPGTEISQFTTNEALPGRELSVNGGRIGSTQFYADGANVTSVALARMSISFSPDTIQEFSVQQSNYSAQYAQAGGAIIQQTTKSGTNSLSGTAYWFHRQKALTANPFSATRSPVLNNDSRPPLRRQQLGGILGGPVVIPKVYNGKDRTFFLVSYEPTRQLTSDPGGPRFRRVPTDAELNGDFSNSWVYFRNADGSVRKEPYNLLYRQFDRRSDGTLALLANPAFDPNKPASVSNARYRFSGFTLFNPNDPNPARRGRVLVDEAGRSYVNPISQKIARALYPQPNITDQAAIDSLLGSNWVNFRETDYRDNRYTVRIDHRLSDRHTLMGRWTEQPQYGDRYQRDPVGYGLISDANVSRQLLGTWIANFSPTTVNEFRANYVFGDFARNFPEELLNRDLTGEFLDIGGPGKGSVNLLGYGGARFFDEQNPWAATNAQGANDGKGYGRFDGLGFSQPQDVGKNREHTYSITDDFSWMRGNMNLKFGFAATHLQLNQANLGVGSLAGGRFSWNREILADKWCNSNPLGGTLAGCSGTSSGGDGFAAFLLGVPYWAQTQTENLSATYYYRWLNLGAYANNDWKVTPNLTLNIGLRYQYQSPRWEKNDFQGQLNLERLEPNPFVTVPAGQQPLTAPVFEFAGRDGRSRYLTPSQKLVFEPRFGFAWTPDVLDRKLVIRGGYGITHGTLMGNEREPIPNIGSQTFSQFRSLSYILGSNDYAPPTNIATCGLARCSETEVPMQFGYNNPVLASDATMFVVPQNGVIRPGDLAGQRQSTGEVRQDRRYQATGVIGDRDFRMPTVQNYSLHVQYQLMANTVVTAGYQGSRGTHLFGPSYNVNRSDPFTGQMPYPGFAGRNSGAIYVLNPTNSSSTYHAFVAEIERRWYRDLQFRFNYTFSKAMDDSSGGIAFPIPNNSFNNASADVPLTRNQNPYNMQLERSVSSTDTPHIFNLVAFWELPFGTGKRLLRSAGWLNHFAGGWQIGTLGRIRSGYPVTVKLGRGNALDLGIPGGELRPDLAPGVPLKNPDWTPENAAFTTYVNPRAFWWPEPGQFGNAARNFAVRLPWVQTLDLSVVKRVRPFGEGRRYFELRGEFFNVLNHRVFESNINNTSLLTAGTQNNLLAGTAPFQTPIAGVQNRYAGLREAGVWDAIIQKGRGVQVDTAIAQLRGPGTGGVGCPSSAAELRTTTGALSPACVARELSINTSFYQLNQNTVSSRIVQLALKFYF